MNKRRRTETSGHHDWALSVINTPGSGCIVCGMPKIAGSMAFCGPHRTAWLVWRNREGTISEWGYSRWALRERVTMLIKYLSCRI